MGLVEKFEVLLDAVGACPETGEVGAVAVADELVEPGGALDWGALFGVVELFDHFLEKLAGVEGVVEFFLELIEEGFVLNASIEVDQQTVHIVVHLKIPTRVFVKQHPSGAAEGFDVAVVVHGKAGDDGLAQPLFSANPADEAVYGGSPPLDWVLCFIIRVTS